MATHEYAYLPPEWLQRVRKSHLMKLVVLKSAEEVMNYGGYKQMKYEGTASSNWNNGWLKKNLA